MLSLTVKNYRRIESASLEISPLCLVSGENEQGKTCLAQAARAALLRDGAPVPGAKKKDGDLMVRRGAKSGEIVLTGEGGTVTVSFPKGKVAESGDAPPRASVYAAGAASLCTLPTRTAADFQGYIDAAPTKADLAAAMSELGFPEKAIDYTWDEIGKHGWDEVAKTGRESATKCKGQWEQIAGEKWGEKKGEDWQPAGWDDWFIEAGEEKLSATVEEARAALETAIGAGAVSQADRERLEAAARDKADEGVADTADVAFEAAKLAFNEATEFRAALPPASNDDGVPCPSCGTVLIVEQPWKSDKATLKEAETVSDAELKKRRKDIAASDGTVSRLKGELEKAKANLTTLRMKAEAAESAAKQLAEMGEPVDEGQITGARTRLETAQQDLAAFRAQRDATALHERILRTLALVDLLAPDGLRKTKLAKALGPWNSHLAELCEVAGWRRVWVDEALDIHMDQDPYWLLSESAQMRTRIVLQIAQAMADQSDMVVVDAADTLDAKGRNGLFALLQSCSVPALICMTANAASKVPDLEAAGLGSSYWLSEGVTMDISGMQEAAE